MPFGKLRSHQASTSEPGLRRRVLHAGAWALALRVTNRLFQLARIVVLARLLSPDDFGLFGIALVSLAALETFSQTGFDQALVQRADDIRPYMDTAFTVQLIRGIVVGGLLALAAPLVGAFFDEPRAIPLVRWIGLAFFLKATVNVWVLTFRKELDFRKLYVYEFAGTLTDLAVSLTAAFLLRSAFALVFGVAAGNLARSVASYLLHPVRPRLRFDQKRARELGMFGRWILGSSILLFLINQGDDLLVGKMLGAAALGLYQMAYLISNLPATEVTHVVSSVMFPAYSKLHREEARLRNAYLRTVQFVSLFAFPLTGGIILLADEVTRFGLGDRWVRMVPAMQVLAVWGLLRSLGAMTGPLFQAVGRPDLATKIQLAKAILLAALIYPLTATWGILGTSLAVVLNAVALAPVAQALAVRITGTPVSELLKRLGIPVVGTLISGGAFLLARSVLPTRGHPVWLLVACVLGVALYAALVLLMQAWWVRTTAGAAAALEGERP